MKAEFIQRVMQIMNELGWDNTESNAFIGSDTTKIEGHIEAVFVDAWRKAINILPKTYFTIKDFSEQKIVSDITNGIGYIVLPNDFYKLSSFKIKGWQTTVDTLIDNNDPLAKIQANEFTRGNICRPICIQNKITVQERQGDNIVPVPTDVIQYYSLPKGAKHEVEEALYIPIENTLNDQTKLTKNLFVPLAYICASMVFYIFEKQDIAQVLEKQATQINK